MVAASRVAKLDNPKLKKMAISMLAKGVPPSEVAAEVDQHPSQITRFKQKNREEIERQAQRYLDALPDIVAHDLMEISDYFKISEDVRKILKSGKDFDKDKMMALQKYCDYIDKRITDIKRSIGLYAAQNPSLVFQQLNIFNPEEGAELVPILQRLLGEEGSGIDYDNAIEVTSS